MATLEAAAPATGAPPTAGCNVELTALPGTGQGTLGFEAFGPEVVGRCAMLDVALARLARELPGLALREAESCGYPEWLAAWVT